jgi:hypothetical protein
MNIEQAVLEKLRELSIEKQQEVLNFADYLTIKSNPKPALRSVKGLCADLKIDITANDIAQARKEMWGNFPREII